MKEGSGCDGGWGLEMGGGGRGKGLCGWEWGGGFAGWVGYLRGWKGGALRL